MSLATFFAAHPATAQRWRRSFPGEAEQAAHVRRLVATLLPDCPYLDEVLLATDELVVNALRHTKSGQPGGAFIVEIGHCDDAVTVAVTDQGGPTEPAVADLDEYAESGRGLRTVAATATGWGWFGNDRARVVTAVFAPGHSLWEIA
ncbi:ATP-binding protein [Actinomadura miaoliensis]|uniref:Histidine kinase/HSP90-like ATPase domain-containing protein n=1 Tax=Actinomadura miaoliensis TaxID=430685 RepID=A0ABP7W648_9ACTN